MASFNVTSWNCRGIKARSPKTQAKADFLETHFSTRPFDILALLETHHKDLDDFPDLLQGYTHTHHCIHTPTQAPETHCGIIVVIDKTTFDIVNTTTYLAGRIITAVLKHIPSQEEYVFTFYYGLHPGATTHPILKKAMKFLKQQHTEITNSFLVGDFNFVEHDIDRPTGLNVHDKTILPFWKSAMEDLTLTDSYRYLHPRQKIYSFHMAGRQLNSCIDRIYVNEANLPNVQKYNYVKTPNSDHTLQVLTYKTLLPYGSGSWKMNTSILRDKLYDLGIQVLLLQMDRLQVHDPISWWTIFLLSVRSYTRDYCAFKRRIERNLYHTLSTEIEQIQAIPHNRLTCLLTTRMEYLQAKLADHQRHQVDGYLVRARLPRFEDKAPSIQKYASMAKSRAKASYISVLINESGEEALTQEDLLKTAHKFYTQLYTPRAVYPALQPTLLRNLSTQVNATQKQQLDAPITLKELTAAVSQLPPDKTPGADGIPIEFYRKFWTLLQERYLAYINAAYEAGFPSPRNVGYIKLIYKDKGTPCDLTNYRPIALLNCDIKILTKTLANRLKLVLPTIIHKSQTCIPGRHIDTTVHTIRDLIQMAENEQMDAAFIFLDQEKAFDRVNHQLLYKVMKKYNIGDTFVKWIQQIYANATSQVIVNGFLTDSIDLHCGVRQGCPISPLLYVLMIELLAAQLRANPNIVGFTVEGEKIVSLHYADDATITITQNRCFKEVIKDLQLYQDATGAKVNFLKTKGLWVGGWQHRVTEQDPPLGIKWTNANVENLGVFFGRDDPAKHTFDKILPKITKSINFWKTFHLSKLAKARVLEIFVASKLLYAAKFYPMPKSFWTQLQKQFTQYINWPHRCVTVSEAEILKLRSDGGLKLIHLLTKSHASQCMWLVRLITSPDFHLNFNILKRLMGEQPSHKSGVDILFSPHQYFKNKVKFTSPFYKEALSVFTALSLEQHVPTLALATQLLFYNRIFIDAAGNPLPNTLRGNKRIVFRYYQQFLDTHTAHTRGQPADATILQVYAKIHRILSNSREHAIITAICGYLPLRALTERQLYAELILSKYRLHHSEEKWTLYFPQLLEWPKIWESVHNILATETTKTFIWEQVHLNFFTTYKKNQFRTPVECCPLCGQLPEDITHTLFHCRFIQDMWTQLLPFIDLIHSTPLTKAEMVFGLMGRAPSIILRNWLTFNFRQVLSQYEYLLSQSKSTPSPSIVKARFNQKIKRAILWKYQYCTHFHTLPFFKKHFQFTPYLVDETAEEIGVADIFSI